MLQRKAIEIYDMAGWKEYTCMSLSRSRGIISKGVDLEAMYKKNNRIVC